MIEKLTKEFEKIRVSLTKSKKLIVADEQLKQILADIQQQ